MARAGELAPEAFAELRDAGRGGSPDLYTTALLAPRPARLALVALAAYDAALERIPFRVSEPTLGEIRLQWWRDQFAACRTGDSGSVPVNAPPALQILADEVVKGRVPAALFVAVADARSFDLSVSALSYLEDAQAHAAKQFGTPFAIMARIIAGHVGAGQGAAGSVAAAMVDRTAYAVGRAYGLARLVNEAPRYAALGCDPLASLRRGHDGDAGSRPLDAQRVAQELHSAHTSARSAHDAALADGLRHPVSTAFLPLALIPAMIAAATGPRPGALTPWQRVRLLAWARWRGV